MSETWSNLNAESTALAEQIHKLSVKRLELVTRMLTELSNELPASLPEKKQAKIINFTPKHRKL